uniref:L-Fucosyltransferase n=1 Tax=Eptatretus burgeri TaxID=7764 RepID=A0A8C4QGS0_EPTBU
MNLSFSHTQLVHHMSLDNVYKKKSTQTPQIPTQPDRKLLSFPLILELANIQPRLLLVPSWYHSPRFKKLPGVWISSSAGRLGNQLGMYASLLSLARLNGRQAYLCPSSAKYLEPLFKLSLPRLPENENVNLTEYQLNYWMEEKYKSISLMRVHLTGSVAAKIHSQFSGANITFVGMHVRRGDYVHIVPKQWKGVIADALYLAKAMERMRGRYPDSVFVVASDDVTWCRHNINVSRGDVYFVADGIPQASPGQDIAVLAACNHTIMTFGTFGFWCAYLAGGDVIYLSNNFLPNSPILKVFRYKAAYLPTWEGIPADLSPLTKKKP